MKKSFQIEGNIVDLVKRRIFPGKIYIENGTITRIIEAEVTQTNNYILPGLIDSHIHIESSMLTPSAFAVEAVKHGTVATVSDPHEIANVIGIDGIDFMINNGDSVPFKFYFGAPSCVPATRFETSGSVLDEKSIENLLERRDVFYLAEMMDFPGVISKEKEINQKINHAKRNHKKIDGHAPGLTKGSLQKYVDQFIETDHEATTLKEAEEKIQKGMKIQIREGSAAKNFENLFPLIQKYPDKLMFCTDDLHPDDLIKGHINLLVKRALKKGANIYDLLTIATKNPIEHYGLDVGIIQKR